MGRLAFFLLLVLGVSLLGYAWMSRRAEIRRAQEVSLSPYEADVAPSTMPVNLLTGLVLATPGELVQAPVIDGFSAPLGEVNGTMTYDAQPFGAWNADYEGRHTGQDWNGIGGMDTDLGEPVYAAARGLVLYAGRPSDSWGRVVILAHRLPDGRFIETLYAHLGEVTVKPGYFVGRGEKLGTVGKAGPAGHFYPAHLHFEMIESMAIEAGMPGYADGAMNRLDPSEMMRRYPAPAGGALPDPYIAVRRLRQQEEALRNMSVLPSSSPYAPAVSPEGAPAPAASPAAVAPPSAASPSPAPASNPAL